MKLPATREELIREGVHEDLRLFTEYAWSAICGNKFVSNWHVDCICEHLQALYNLEIRELIINIPPRHTKSLTVSVAFPAWLWLKEAEHQILNISMIRDLSTRDSRTSRELIESAKYEAVKRPDANGMTWQISKDQNEKSLIANTAGGRRQAVSIDGRITGLGCDTMIIDDPNSASHLTAAEVEKVGSVFNQTLPTRFNNPKESRLALIQQRVSELDATGFMLEVCPKATLVRLPARYEKPSFVSMVTDSSTGQPWRDRRKEQGELLWPERFDDEEVSKLEARLGTYHAAGQLQQRPAPAEGGMFKRKDWQRLNGIRPDQIAYICRAWDCAGTPDGGDWTSGTLMLRMNTGRYVIIDEIRGQWSYAKRESRIKSAAETDVELFHPMPVTYVFEQEAGSAGKDAVNRRRDALLKNSDGSPSDLSGRLRVVIERPTGDKEVRAEPLSIAVENHNVDILERPFTERFIGELAVFPAGKHDDSVDSASYAYNYLAGKNKGRGVWGKKGGERLGAYKQIDDDPFG